MAKTPAARYRYRQTFGMIAYVALLVFVLRQFKIAPPSGAMRYVFAILPALPIVGIVAAIGAYLIEETDEFVRTKVVMTVLGGTGLTLSVTAVWGFLERFELAPHLELFWVFPIFCAGMLVSSPFVRWKFR